PVMRYVDLRDLTIASALALRPRGGEVLAEGEVPLIWAYDGAGIRAIVLGFGLPESDLPLQIAFPIFLNNALAWLSGTGGAFEAGDPLVVPAGPHPDAVLIDPAGNPTVLQARDGEFVGPALDAMRFGTPAALLLLVFLPVAAALARRRVTPRGALALRLLVLALLVTALASPVLSTRGGDLSVVFAVDRSDSIPADRFAA